MSRGWVSEELAREFPELRLLCAEVAIAPERRSPAAVRQRLRHASDRFTGARAIALRTEPIPWAYRVFFRHIGIDPDEQRTPIEALAVERLRAGGFKSDGLIADAILLATLETGVPLLAVDAAALTRSLGLRTAEEGESLGGRELRPRELVIADGAGAVAVLFGDPSAHYAISPATERLLLCAVLVKGVPDVVGEETLWLAADIVAGPPRGATIDAI